ncbi:hypothetical protein HZ326_29912 [Fusarium oxysporum f. sp. albedinis]|nr:hypothetical protein HZ326_29912 [Fusarium oxysporum f. sp. albedinis]
MPEASFPDYRLSGRVLQTWLRRKFKDDTIIVESKDGEYVFTLPDGKELSEDDKLDICELRTKKKKK